MSNPNGDILEEIVIPSSVRKIGAYAFRKSGVKTVIFENANGWTAGETAFTTEELTTDAAAKLKSIYKSKWVRTEA